MDATVDWSAGCRKASALASVQLASVLVAAVSVSGQTTLRRPADKLAIVVEVQQPSYTDQRFEAVGLEGAVVIPLRPGMTLVTGGLLSWARVEGLDASVAVSNVYGSLQFGSDGAYGTLTLTLPTTRKYTNQGYAADAGFLMDLERPERFTPKALSIAAAATPRWKLGSRGLVGGRLGIAVVSPPGTEAEFYGRYGAFAETEVGPALFGLDFSGAVFFKGVGESFADRSLHHLTVIAGLPGLFSGPHLLVRVPIDDQARAALDLLIGLRLVF
jgi:hypothetical protein